jgi:hypothetical protein
MATAIVIILAAFWARETLVWRDDEYLRLVDGFKRARSITKQPDKERASFPDRWQESFQLPDGVTATVEALDTLNPRATVTYSDARTVHDVYPPRTYTNLVDVRMEGTRLYVMREITLFMTERRLALFDLTHREVIADRRVDSSD